MKSCQSMQHDALSGSRKGKKEERRYFAARHDYKKLLGHPSFPFAPLQGKGGRKAGGKGLQATQSKFCQSCRICGARSGTCAPERAKG